MSEVADSNDNRQTERLAMSPEGEDVNIVVDGGDVPDRGNGCGYPMAYVAPALRVEELRDECIDDVASGLSACGTDDEFAVSGGDVSDQDGGHNVTVSSSDGEFVVPDEELQRKIVTQVEHYFADENIIHDTFMLKHVRRNRMGYVSLKLVTSFRKVKPLTRDHRVVAHSLRQLSDRLEVNDEGTKVRRRDPLPEFDETAASRTVLVAGLQMETPTMDSISEIMNGCGEIISIRILRAGKPLPSDIKKHLTRLGAEFVEAACAVVEFDEHASAVKACEHVAKTDEKIKAVLFAGSKSERSKKDEKADVATRKKSDKDSSSENWREGSGQNQDGKGKQPKAKTSSKNEWKRSARVDELSHEGDIDSAGSESDASADNWRTAKRGGNGAAVASRSSLSPQMDPNRLSPCQSPRTTPRSTPKSSPKSSPRTSPNMRRRTIGTSPLAVETDERRKSVGSSPSHSPWVQRRLKAQETSVSPLAGNSANSSPRLGRKANGEDNVAGAISRFANAVGVIRQPKGPDGTKGFYGGCGRGRTIDNNETVGQLVSVNSG